MILLSPNLIKKCLCERLMLSWYIQIYYSQNKIDWFLNL